MVVCLMIVFINECFLFVDSIRMACYPITMKRMIWILIRNHYSYNPRHRRWFPDSISIMPLSTILS